MEERDLIRQGGVLVGYFEDGTAVLDSAFFGCDVGHRLIRTGRAVSWQPGVAKRLEQIEKERPVTRRVRVWQLKPEADLNKKFIGYWELTDRFGGPSRSDYQMVFDGRLDTDHPEELYERYIAFVEEKQRLPGMDAGDEEEKALAGRVSHRLQRGTFSPE